MKNERSEDVTEPKGDALVWTHMADRAWYILVVSPLCEKAVASRLKRRMEGMLTFVPIATRFVRKRHRKNVEISHNVMPRYLFVGFEGPPPWLYVRETQGVQGVFAVDGAPYRVGWELVSEVITRCATGFYDPPDAPPVQRGMGVVVAGGRHRGVEGRVTSIDKRAEIADVLIDLLDREVAVRIRLDDLVSVSYASHRMSG